VFGADADGCGNWCRHLPLAGLVAVPVAYLVGVLVLDLNTGLIGDHRKRSSYRVWWWFAVLPAVAWLAWLKLAG
jgi:hypothetical protein